MQGLSVHGRGTQLITLDDMKNLETPPATETWQPISHYDLANSIKVISQDMLHGHSLIGEQYGTARDFKQMFAVLTFKSDVNEMGLSIGFRNSTDKSMAVGIAIGSSVFVCSNLMMTGEITVMKKHSVNVLASLEEATINTLYKAQFTFSKLVRDSQTLKGIGLSDEDAFKTLGLLFGHGVLSPRQLPVALEQWKKPAHPDFEPRNAFSLYNSCTHALKETAPMSVIERHISLHNILTGRER